MMMAVLYMVMNDYPPHQILTEIGRSSHTLTTEAVALCCEVAVLWTDALYNEEKGTWKYLQIDEFTCGARKYQRGKRVRARGVDWFMSLVRINVATNKVDRFFVTPIEGRRTTCVIFLLNKGPPKVAAPHKTLACTCAPTPGLPGLQGEPVRGCLPSRCPWRNRDDRRT